MDPALPLLIEESIDFRLSTETRLTEVISDISPKYGFKSCESLIPSSPGFFIGASYGLIAAFPGLLDFFLITLEWSNDRWLDNFLHPRIADTAIHALPSHPPASLDSMPTEINAVATAIESVDHLKFCLRTAANHIAKSPLLADDAHDFPLKYSLAKGSIRIAIEEGHQSSKYFSDSADAFSEHQNPLSPTTAY